jgi:3-oxoacyl-[acyl-carrier protein] reductase
MKSALAVLSLLAVIWKSDAFVPKAAFRKASSMCVSTATAETPLSKSAKSEPKVCLVTGSSQGIGKAIALELGRCGQKVVVNYIQGCEKDAEETVEEIKSLGGDAIAVQADCTHPKEVEKMFDTIIDIYGGCDVLVNNAGITKDNLVMRMKPEQWQAVIDVNLSGTFTCIQEFVMHTESDARIINMASVVGQIGNPGQANYAASKGGVIGLTRSCAKEFSKLNIQVNCVCPGYIASPMTDKLDHDYLNSLNEMIPLGRLGRAEEVAGLVRFLALDPAAEYMTGHEFNVDGGIGIGAH